MRAKIFRFMVSTMVLGFCVFGQAQSGVDQQFNQQVKIKYNNFNRVYRAMFLLDKRQNWMKASELLRQVLEDSNGLNREVRSKIKDAKSKIDNHPFRVGWQRTWNMRHIVKPYLDTVRLLNEALMLMRIKLNMSSDIEPELVEKLIMSYFFPGMEDQAEILFPDPDSYAYTLFQLDKRYIDSTRTAPSDVINDPRLRITERESSIRNFIRRLLGEDEVGPDDPNGEPSDGEGPIISGRFPPFSRDDDDKDGEPEQEVKLSAEDARELYSILEQYFDEEKTKAHFNRYLEWSLLLQAVAEPISILYDEQLQAFVKGLRMKIKVATTDEEEEVRNLEEFLKEGLNQQKEQFKIERGIGNSASRTALYLISGMGPAELLRARYLLFVVKYLENYDALVKIGALPPVAMTAENIAKWIRVLGEKLTAYAVSGEAVGATKGMRVAGFLSRMMVNLGVGGKNVSTFLAEKFAKTSQYFANKDLIKSGRLAKGLVAVAIATDLTVWYFEQRKVTEPEIRRALYNRHMSRTAATLMYLVPYAGWGALVLDGGHMLWSGIPSGADVIEGFSTKALPNALLYLCDYDYTVQELELIDMEHSFEIFTESDNQWLRAQALKKVRTAKDLAELAIAQEYLKDGVQVYSHARLMVVYYGNLEHNNIARGVLGRHEEIYLNGWTSLQKMIKSEFKKEFEKRRNVLGVIK